MPSPEVTLPGPFVAPPSPDLPVATRWLLASVNNAEFEQGVLYGCGPAQVGFSVRLSSFHRFTLSSRGILSPEPLRLTQRVRERPGVSGLPLPFVAMGSFPHIYRREGLSPGDPD